MAGMVWYGDLVRALAAAQTPEQSEAAAKACGFELRKAFRDLLAESADVTAARLNRGQSLPDSLDVTAENLAGAIMVVMPSLDNPTAEEVVFWALVELWTKSAT